MVEPKFLAGDRGLSFASALPVMLETAAGPVLALGPIVVGGASRLDFAWWTRRPAGGALEAHRSVFALPSDEIAVVAHLFDLEGDGRPELAVLTMPGRLRSFFGEFRLHLFRAQDRAMVPASPFFSATTDLNFWQFPAIAHRPAPGGVDLLLAYYKGLTKARLHVETFRSNGAGSFEPDPRDVEVSAPEEADRDFIQWEDVDGDGIADLVTAGAGSLRVHRGRADREHPLESSPSWAVGAIALRGGGVSISFSSDGRVGVTAGSPRGVLFQDLDGDGMKELLAFGPRDKPVLYIRRLTRPADPKPGA